jgi:hypothetical protein
MGCTDAHTVQARQLPSSGSQSFGEVQPGQEAQRVLCIRPALSAAMMPAGLHHQHCCQAVHTLAGTHPAPSPLCATREPAIIDRPPQAELAHILCFPASSTSMAGKQSS